MIPYISLFTIASVFAFDERVRKPESRKSLTYNTDLKAIWFFYFIFLIIFIGLRWFVGGDWGSYRDTYLYTEGMPFFERVTPTTDFGHALLMFLSEKLGMGYVGVNFLSGIIFSFGLIKFCLSLPRPYLAFAVSIPYLITIVGMGYMRQGTALAIGMYALTFLFRKEFSIYFFLIFLAALFHKSAIIMFPFAIFVSAKSKFLLFIASASLAFFGFLIFVESYVDRFLTHYIEAGYSSSGATIRIIMNVIPALIIFLFRDKMNMSFEQKRLWMIYSVVTMILFVGIFALDISTTIDRIGLYLLPLQLVVASYLPDIFSKKYKFFVIFLTLLYYGVVQIVWLLYANNAESWVPYMNIIFSVWL